MQCKTDACKVMYAKLFDVFQRFLHVKMQIYSVHCKIMWCVALVLLVVSHFLLCFSTLSRRERSRERDHSRSRDKRHRKSRSRDRHEDYYRERSRERDRHRERERDRDRERDREREREYRR